MNENKCVMVSIQPQWCELIASGKKTLEVRKTRPKLETPFKCYIYCTKAPKGWVNLLTNQRLDGRAIGEFVCDEIRLIGFEYGGIKEDLERALNGSCLTNDNARNYFISKGGRRKGPFLYGWHISSLQIYDNPKELSKFRRAYQRDAEGFIKCDHNPCDYVSEDGHYLHKCTSDCPHLAEKYKLTRPPQSWGYVEELE